MSTEQELAQQEQQRQIEEAQKQITDQFENLKKILEENKYDEQAYRKGTILNMSSETLTKISHLLPHIQGRFETILEGMSRELAETSTVYQYVQGMLGFASLELLALHNEMTQLHINACEAGLTIHRDELDKEDAKVKVTERGGDAVELIVPETKIIDPSNPEG